jgi:hypothetical protein
MMKGAAQTHGRVLFFYRKFLYRPDVIACTEPQAHVRASFTTASDTCTERSAVQCR